MVSMATHNATLKKGVVPTKSIMSLLLLDLDYGTFTRLKLRYRPFITWLDVQIRCKLSTLHIHEYQ